MNAGLTVGNSGCESCAKVAKKVDFPVLFSPTRNVKGRSGIKCRLQKLRTSLKSIFISVYLSPSVS